MSTQPELFPVPCVLCGSPTAATSKQLVEWIEPVDGKRWENAVRCVDRAACRIRVEQEVGEAWPVADRTPVPEPVATPTPPVALPGERLAKAEAAPPEPDSAVEPAASDEEIAWLS